MQGEPVSGFDATGADAFASVITAAGGNRFFRHLRAYCETQDAVLSIDGQDADEIIVPAGVGIEMDGLVFEGPVQAKNRAEGSNYTNLRVTVW